MSLLRFLGLTNAGPAPAREPESLRVIGERLYDLAIARASARARSDDPRELFLERGQLLDARVYFREVAPGDPIGVVARTLGMIGQIEERANVVEFEPERPGVPDER